MLFHSDFLDDLTTLINNFNQFITKYNQSNKTSNVGYNNYDYSSVGLGIKQNNHNQQHKSLYITTDFKQKQYDVKAITNSALSKISKSINQIDPNNLPAYLEHPVYNGYDAWLYLDEIEFHFNGRTLKFLVFDSAMLEENVLIRPEVFFSKFTSQNIIQPNLPLLDKRLLEKQLMRKKLKEIDQEQRQSKVSREDDLIALYIKNKLALKYSDQQIADLFLNQKKHYSSDELFDLGWDAHKVRAYELDFADFRRLIRETQEHKKHKRDSNYHPQAHNNYLNTVDLEQVFLWEDKMIDLQYPLNFSNFTYTKADNNLFKIEIPHSLYCVAWDSRGIKVLGNDNDDIKQILLANPKYLTKNIKRQRDELLNLFPNDINHFLNAEYFFSNVAAVSLVNSDTYARMFYDKTHYALINDEDVNRAFYQTTKNEMAESKKWKNDFDKAMAETKLKARDYIENKKREAILTAQIDDQDFSKGINNSFGIFNTQNNEENILNKKSTTAELLAAWNKQEDNVSFARSDENNNLENILEELNQKKEEK